VRARIAIIVLMVVASMPFGVPATAHAAACGQSITAPLPDKPWPLRRLRPELVWPLTTGKRIIVAVIDSGVSPAHPALAGQVLPGIDLVDPTGDGTCDEAGHGTLIAGIIAGLPTPSSGFLGMAPDAKILPIRVLAGRERTFDENLPIRIATAIRMATDRGAGVINLSLTTAPVPELADAVKYAIAHDVIVVAAAGNEGGQSDQPAYPAAFDGVIAVAGVDENGDHVQTSTPGDYVDIAAPGKNIAGPAAQGGGYQLEPEGGTSFAAAYVSGVAALVKSYREDLNGPQIVQRILRTADRPAGGWDRDVGSGVVNPYWAVISVSAGGQTPGPQGQVALHAPAPDPNRALRLAAIWVAVLTVVLAALVFVAVWVVRTGRRRGWRPGRTT
jgi:type VII secretion-associated serine protease mycosin